MKASVYIFVMNLLGKSGFSYVSESMSVCSKNSNEENWWLSSNQFISFGFNCEMFTTDNKLLECYFCRMISFGQSISKEYSGNKLVNHHYI